MKPPTRDERRSGPNEVPLSTLLRRAGAELQAWQPPPLRSDARPSPTWRPALAAAGPRAAVARRPRWTAWSGALTCGLVLAGSWWLMLGPPARSLGPVADSGFLAVAPAERWERLEPPAGQPAWVVTTELPGERLAAFGLPYDPSRAAEPVRAELLLHPASGEVLAVRLVAQ